MGAPKQNSNAQRHGLRSSKLPRSYKSVGNDVGNFRESLEAEVREKHGSISVVHAGIISTAVRHEKRAKLAEWWIRKCGNGEKSELTVMEQATLTETAANASDARDKVVAKLGINAQGNGDGFGFATGDYETALQQGPPSTETASDDTSGAESS